MDRVAKTKRVAAAVLGGIVLSQVGCGLVFKSWPQTVLVSSQPEGALVTTNTEEGGITPVRVRLRRRRPLFSVVRVAKEKYASACRILEVKRDPLLLTLDSIPVGLPLLLDGITGSWPGDYPETVEIPLAPLREGNSDVLPLAADILSAWTNAHVNFCDPSPQLRTWMEIRSRYAQRAEKIVVSAGEMSHPYDIVGRVDVNAKGADYVAWNYWRIGAFGSLQIQHYQHKEDPVSLNEMLKFKAFEIYGDRFDAIVNVHYETLPGNDVSAGGVAVRFVARDSTTQRSGEARLEELKSLLDRGLITREEYETKRAQVLNEL